MTENGGSDAESVIRSANGHLQVSKLIQRIAIHQMIRDALETNGYVDFSQWEMVGRALGPSIVINRWAMSFLQFRKQAALAQLLTVPSDFLSEPRHGITWNAMIDVEKLVAQANTIRTVHDWKANNTLGWIEGAAMRLPRAEIEPGLRNSLTTPLVGEHGHLTDYAHLTETAGARGHEANFLILSIARVEEDRRMLRLAIAAKKLQIQGEAIFDSPQKNAKLANLPSSEALDLYGRPFVIQQRDDSEERFKISRVDDPIGSLLVSHRENRIIRRLFTTDTQFFSNWLQRASIVVR